jgi:hypothetical protein
MKGEKPDDITRFDGIYFERTFSYKKFLAQKVAFKPLKWNES